MSQIPAVNDMPLPTQRKGMAITAMVLGIVAIVLSCVPLLPMGIALAALIVGIIALVKISSEPQTYGGRGMALAGVICAVLAFVLSVASIGIMLPALAKARQAAKMAKSSAQLRDISSALITYANANQGRFPPEGPNWEAPFIANGSINPGTLVSPAATTNGPSYFYLRPPDDLGNLRRVILVENPEHYRNTKTLVAFGDGSVGVIEAADFPSVLGSLKGSDGKPWHPWRP